MDDHSRSIEDMRLLLGGSAVHRVETAAPADREPHAVDGGMRRRRRGQLPRSSAVDRYRRVQHAGFAAHAWSVPHHNDRVTVEPRGREGLVRSAKAVEKLQCAPRVAAAVRFAENRKKAGAASIEGTHDYQTHGAVCPR